MGTELYTCEQFIKAIAGSGAIKSTIARRVGCVRDTVDSYIRRHPTVKQAYEAESQNVLDMSESVVIVNITLAQQIQVATRQRVDAGDAKWMLSRKGKDRGYGESHEISGPGGGKIPMELTIDWDEGAGITRSFEGAPASGSKGDT